MEPKVMFNISWHEGIPDGNKKVSLVRDDFDMMDEQQTIEEIKQALLEYGATSIIHEYSFHHSHEYHFTATIKKKNPRLPEHLAKFNPPTEQDIKVEVELVNEHRGRYFKLQEVHLELD